MLLLTVLATALAGTTCTSLGSPEVVYTSYEKSGGAAPAPDTVMFSEEWVVDGKRVFAHARPYLEAATRTPDVDWAWDTAKTTPGRVIQDSHTHYEVHYRTEVRLFRPSGAELVPGLVEWRGKMRCARVELRGVP